HTIEQAVNSHGLYAVGFLTYEAAAAFHLTTHAPTNNLPLLWFGLYRPPKILRQLPAPAHHYPAQQWEPALDAAAYTTTLHAIKNEIAQGNTYQVNFTFPLYTPFQGDAYSLFTHLARAQQA